MPGPVGYSLPFLRACRKNHESIALHRNDPFPPHVHQC
jgi:hypothetical protein